jgi:hypothetical protein
LPICFYIKTFWLYLPYKLKLKQVYDQGTDWYRGWMPAGIYAEDGGSDFFHKGLIWEETGLLLKSCHVSAPVAVLTVQA